MAKKTTTTEIMMSISNILYKPFVIVGNNIHVYVNIKMKISRPKIKRKKKKKL